MVCLFNWLVNGGQVVKYSKTSNVNRLWQNFFFFLNICQICKKKAEERKNAPKWRKKTHMGNTWPSHMCVIKEYRYFTISLNKYHGWCQYHKSISILSKPVKKNGQERSRTVYTVKKRSIWSKPDKNWLTKVKSGRKRSQMVKNGNKMVKRSSS